MSMSKRGVYTKVTPLPTDVSRQVAIEGLRDHILMIELNPLVIERHQCRPPSFASPEEYHATAWYSITDRISYMPGIKGKVQYHACMQDIPDGLQTHCFAALGTDIKGKWTIGGTLPGEPRQPVELGLNMPKEGLYLREDVDFKTSFMTYSTVKKNLLVAHANLVGRLIERNRLREGEMRGDTQNQKFSTLVGSQYSGGGHSDVSDERNSWRMSMATSSGASVSHSNPETPSLHGASPAFPPGSPRYNAMMAAHPDTPPLGSHHSWQGQGQGHPSPRMGYHNPMEQNGQPFVSPLYNQMDPAYRQANPYATTTYGMSHYDPGAEGKSRPGSYQLPVEMGSTTPHPDRNRKRSSHLPNAPVEMEG
ncbi:hypothetical protein LTS18_006263 [Coniosporium uncinatum]|uniref:Uncharacterized protein n=1 Tax=Coniosporium uncinatum TaxID=93489 RepID=A0ACC3DQN7_9PEZI|nr:hypothetical protein LTS18_006263 [Coniosporium uncinatum]